MYVWSNEDAAGLLLQIFEPVSDGEGKADYPRSPFRWLLGWADIELATPVSNLRGVAYLFIIEP